MAEPLDSHADVCFRCRTKICCRTELPTLTRIDLARVSANPAHSAAAARLLALYQGQEACQGTAGVCPLLSDTCRCTIHGVHPIDCRLFPLDLVIHRGKYWWIVYELEECELSRLVTDKLLDEADGAIEHLSPAELEDFARRDVPAAWASAQRLLREVRLPAPGT